MNESKDKEVQRHHHSENPFALAFTGWKRSINISGLKKKNPTHIPARSLTLLHLWLFLLGRRRARCSWPTQTCVATTLLSTSAHHTVSPALWHAELAQVVPLETPIDAQNAVGKGKSSPLTSAGCLLRQQCTLSAELVHSATTRLLDPPPMLPVIKQQKWLALICSSEPGSNCKFGPIPLSLQC